MRKVSPSVCCSFTCKLAATPSWQVKCPLLCVYFDFPAPCFPAVNDILSNSLALELIQKSIQKPD